MNLLENLNGATKEDLKKHSENLEPMVIYRALYGEKDLWVRPASMWNEIIEKDGYTGPRFQYIE